MENSKFRTITETYKYKKGTYYDDITAGTVLVQTTPYIGIVHATPKNSQISRYGSLPSDIKIQPSSDRDLLKLWSHATIERKYGLYASKELLRKELENRGYTLNETGHRWKKPEATTF